MAITKTVHKWERVVPVRFARAPHVTDPTISSGTYDANAPEPDDRGFLPHRFGGAVLPVGLDEAVAVAARPETRVRLIRMDMENTGQLFVTSSNTGIFDITQPAAGAVLPSTKEMMIKLRAIASGTANMEVRFGSIGGPIIHRMEVIVNPLIDVRVVAHVPTINGNPVNDPRNPGTSFPAQSTRSNASIQALITGANTIYFPYGIRLVLDAAVDRAGVLAFTNQGMVDDLSNEFNLATSGPNSNRVAGAVNAIFVPQIANILLNPDGTPNNPIYSTAGVATSAITDRRNYGLFVADWATGFQVIAHELGHLFNVVNDPTNSFLHINTAPDPAIPGTGRDVRFDTISRRRLLWAYTNFFGGAPPAPRGHDLAIRDDVGYGNNQPGAMLTIKQLNNDKSDLEMNEVRRTAARLP